MCLTASAAEEVAGTALLKELGREGKLGCFRKTYSRPAGSLSNTCPADYPDHNGGLCYPSCRDDFSGVGPTCWQSHCPDRFRDVGPVCKKPDVYGRGVGYPLWRAKQCEQEHSQGCERYGMLVYPKCREGFGAFGCCLCTPPCPDGMKELLGVSCAKHSYSRGRGKAPGCSSDKEQEGPVCYDKCSPGFSGVGTLCWSAECPAAFPASCGPLCAASQETCGDIGSALGKQVANIALSGAAFATCAAAAFSSPAAAAACWGAALAKAAQSGSTSAEYWQDNFIMCEDAAGDSSMAAAAY